MSEGKWVAAKFEDVEKGDTVRVVRKEGPQTVITEGKVTEKSPPTQWRGVTWMVENYETFYDNEFVPDEDGFVSSLEKLVPPFEWPTKLGAVVTGTDDAGKYSLVLVKLSRNGSAENHQWWSYEWGIVTPRDVSGLENLTVVSEGVTVEA